MQAALVILDGWGLGDHDHRDAVKEAETPNFDRYADTGAYGTLDVSGRRVGLPEGQMGNSEVGHLNIGAGRVVKQAYTRINDSIDDGSFRENDVIAGALDHVEETGGRIHFMGLVSAGGVHSQQQHLHALIGLAADRGVEAVTHAFTDGRDTDPHSGEGYLRELESVVEKNGTGEVATVSGRYFAMDRDQNWERTKKAYDAIVHREAEHEAESAVEAVKESYERTETDEFVEPTLISGQPALEDGDAVFFFNFRPDRARQMVSLLANLRPEDWSFDPDPPDIHLATMTEYDETFTFPVAYPPEDPKDTLGEVLSREGKTQLRLAESEKYAHVTYFLNGGREVKFDGEIRRIVESPDVPTYDMQPEMNAEEVTDTAVDIIDSEDPDALVLNYANPDMVGHTGDFDAAVAAVEAVDRQLGRLAAAVQRAGGHTLVTADHGNADDMGTAESPFTAHTTNPVPFVYLAPDGTDGGRRVRSGGSLCDLAPTMLELMDIDQPETMTGESLLE
ncbi:2,3-bisphosphoglycerate-independent phosphoglycerate mutase [Halopelagius longus]|uniref:2,3-bisphosphoglycerate-independent phosphoglycerate mutase n=1 Tax=Halopelagius longus TaxID=1236180 RepID=A0A1H0YN78_9EURY|nr:2,3-bisphosphoglycerate-independent phosphoglycerate mutase [Halopelagius longus]RDI72585.1 2,3-bisphosphoglycerate-independent phosphoglycerate mutase [Halopelagius longus]SDQ16615.1 phosphoglycerate mutase [Halopelagius longus]